MLAIAVCSYHDILNFHHDGSFLKSFLKISNYSSCRMIFTSKIQQTEQKKRKKLRLREGEKGEIECEKNFKAPLFLHLRMVCWTHFSHSIMLLLSSRSSPQRPLTLFEVLYTCTVLQKWNYSAITMVQS